jgi:hypothetical protein
MNEITYQLAKGKPWHRGLYSLCLLAFLAIATARWIDTGKLSAATLFSLLTLVVLGLIAFRGLFDNRVILTIGSDGIWFAHWGIAKPLHWSEVVRVRKFDAARGDPFICMDVRGQSSQCRDEIPKFSFRTAMLDVSTDEAFQLVSEYWQSAQLR